MTHVLRGKTLGLVGLGYVARHVAKIAQAPSRWICSPGARGYRRRKSPPAAGAEACDLDDLIRRARTSCSIHATLTPQSRGLIDARRIGLMKPKARG